MAIIDSVTTPVCQDFHMLYYLYGAPEKSTLPYEAYPPQHFNCRSSITPTVMTFQELGIPFDELTQERRDLLTVPTIESFSYTDFIKSQPPIIQKEILGAVRYDLWRKGEIQISQFYTRDGRKYSLYELQRKGYTISAEYLRYIRK